MNVSVINRPQPIRPHGPVQPPVDLTPSNFGDVNAKKAAPILTTSPVSSLSPAIVTALAAEPVKTTKSPIGQIEDHSPPVQDEDLPVADADARKIAANFDKLKPGTIAPHSPPVQVSDAADIVPTKHAPIDDDQDANQSPPFVPPLVTQPIATPVTAKYDAAASTKVSATLANQEKLAKPVDKSGSPVGQIEDHSPPVQADDQVATFKQISAATLYKKAFSLNDLLSTDFSTGHITPTNISA